MLTGLTFEETNTHQVTESLETQDLKYEIGIEKVVCYFNVRNHLYLRDIATVANNVEYLKENHRVVIEIENPNLTAHIWSLGKITCVGAKSEEEAKISTRSLDQFVQQIGFENVKFQDFSYKVFGAVNLPFTINLDRFCKAYNFAIHEPLECIYEEATLKVFRNGNITATAPSVSAMKEGIRTLYEHIYPAFVDQFRKSTTMDESEVDGENKIENKLFCLLCKSKAYKGANKKHLESQKHLRAVFPEIFDVLNEIGREIANKLIPEVIQEIVPKIGQNIVPSIYSQAVSFHEENKKPENQKDMDTISANFQQSRDDPKNFICIICKSEIRKKNTRKFSGWFYHLKHLKTRKHMSAIFSNWPRHW